MLTHYLQLPSNPNQVLVTNSITSFLGNEGNSRSFCCIQFTFLKMSPLVGYSSPVLSGLLHFRTLWAKYAVECSLLGLSAVTSGLGSLCDLPGGAVVFSAHHSLWFMQWLWCSTCIFLHQHRQWKYWDYCSPFLFKTHFGHCIYIALLKSPAFILGGGYNLVLSPRGCSCSPGWVLWGPSIWPMTSNLPHHSRGSSLLLGTLKCSWHTFAVCLSLKSTTVAWRLGPFP